jgi:CubicO group peptidase (beta-lactamase class C family)
MNRPTPRRVRFLLSTLFLATAATASPLPAQAPNVQESAGAAVDRELDRIFERWDSDRTPGCAVGIARAGEPVLARSWGMANLEHAVPSTAGTIYEAGSVSKQFTAAAVVLLALDGALSLDDDVRAWVPELPDHGQRITLRHLLNHTSGLRDWGSVAAISGWGRNLRTHDHDHVLDILARQSELNYPPGDAYSYTNSGYNLLAVIVERVSGSSFADFSRERIFEPLGLSDTQWRDDYRRLVPGRATAYSPTGNGFLINQPIEHVHGNGGLLTTVGDLLAWTEALAAGALGGPGFVELMHETGVLNSGRPIAYAAGLQVGDYRGTSRVSHTGATSGYRAFLARYPEQDLSVALLCNVSAVNPGAVGNRVSDLFLGDLPEDGGAEGDLPAVTLASRDLQSRAGLYRDVASGAPLALVMDEDQLRMEGGPTLRPLSTETFQIGSGDGRLTFQSADDRERTGFVRTTGPWEEGAYEPVDPFAPTVEELAPYIGDYHSSDAETTLRVALEAGRLVIHRRPSSSLPLEPVYRDAFRSPLGFVRFHRDGRGRVTEFGISQARVHDIRFERAWR